MEGRELEINGDSFVGDDSYRDRWQPGFLSITKLTAKEWLKVAWASNLLLEESEVADL